MKYQGKVQSILIIIISRVETFAMRKMLSVYSSKWNRVNSLLIKEISANCNFKCTLCKQLLLEMAFKPMTERLSAVFGNNKEL